jgi:uncharacterized membrane protein
MSEAILFYGGAFLIGAEVVGAPLGGYVYSNYISKQKSWGSFGIGTVVTAILIPVVGFSYVVYMNQPSQKARHTT